MEKLIIYGELFSDSFLAALILPIHNEMLFLAMSSFKNYNNYLIFFITLFASVAGSISSWWFGKKLALITKTKFFTKKQFPIKKLEEKWNKYVVWLLLLASVKTVGNPLSLLSGFFATGIKKFIILIMIGKLIYYFYLIFVINL